MAGIRLFLGRGRDLVLRGAATAAAAIRLVGPRFGRLGASVGRHATLDGRVWLRLLGAAGPRRYHQTYLHAVMDVIASQWSDMSRLLNDQTASHCFFSDQGKRNISNSLSKQMSDASAYVKTFQTNIIFNYS